MEVIQKFLLSPQEMDQHIKDLKQELNEQVSKIIGIENILELTQKERDHTEELLMDQLEVQLSAHISSFRN